MHPCAPNLEELKQIERELMSAPSTDENMKKIDAVQKQIARAEREAAAG